MKTLFDTSDFFSAIVAEEMEIGLRNLANLYDGFGASGNKRVNQLYLESVS